MNENVYQSVWPGLNSYTEDDQARFFGRGREIDLLQDVISTEPLCTIYGSSGVGKTSLLLAGVFPRLRVRGCLPVYLRLGHDEGAKPYAVQIVDGCLQAAQKARLEVKETCPARDGAARETLWEWFHRHEFVNAVKKPVRPVLVIDQFEEVFTLGAGKAASEEWFDELTDLCSNSVPEVVADAMADSEDGLGFSTEDQSWHVVVCLREDFLSYLEERTVEYPVFRQNRIAISALSKEKALEAVLNGGRDILDEPVARMIVDYVGGSTGKIEAPLLSLFCSRLDLLRQKNGQEKISLELVERNKDDILGNFYNESMGRVSESARDYLETVLLNANGYRNQVQIDDVEQHGVKPDEWKALERERLLHVITRDNVKWLEFSHDTLAPIARTARERRQAEQERRTMLRKLKRQRKRTRHVLYVLCGFVVLLVAAAYASWLLFYKEHVVYYREFTKKWGHPVGVGEPLTMEQVSHREYSFKMIHRGKYMLQGWRIKPTYAYRVEAINGRLELTTVHNVKTYLWRGEDTNAEGQRESQKAMADAGSNAGVQVQKENQKAMADTGSEADSFNQSHPESGKHVSYENGGKENTPNENGGRAEVNDNRRSGFLSSDKLSTVCAWEFMCDKNGRPKREIGYDDHNEVVWMMPYAVVTDADGNVKSAVVHYTLDDVNVPARLRTDSAEYVKITYDDTTGFERLHEFLDRMNKNVKGVDGAFAQSLEYYPDGRLKRHASLDKEGRYTLDDAGNTGMSFDYSPDYREVTWTSFGTNGEIRAVKDGYAKGVDRYDKWGNHVERVLYDTNNVPFGSATVWPIAILERDSHGLLLSTTLKKARSGGSDSEPRETEVLRISVDEHGNETNLVWRLSDGEARCKPGTDVHMVCKTFIGKNKCNREWYLGVDGNPVTNENGIAVEVFHFNETGNVLDTVDLYALSGAGGVFGYTNVHHLCRFLDRYGNTTEERYFDADERPTVDGDGIAFFESQYRAGDLHRRDYYALEGRGGCFGATNVHHVIRFFDKKEVNGEPLMLKEEYFGCDDKPVGDNTGVIRIEHVYDARGKERLCDLYYAGMTGESAGDTNLCHKVVTFDASGRLETIQNFGKDERYVADGTGMVVGRVSYFPGTNEIRRMTDAFSMPLAWLGKNGRCRETNFYRENGNEWKSEETDFSGNCHLVQNDKHGYVVYERFTSAIGDGSADFSLYGVAKIKRKFGIEPPLFLKLLGAETKEEVTCVEESYFDAHGKPTLNRYGVAGWRRKTNYMTGTVGPKVSFDIQGKETSVIEGKVVVIKNVVSHGLADRNGIKAGDIVCRYNEYDSSLPDPDCEIISKAVKEGMKVKKRLVIARRLPNGTYGISSYTLPSGPLRARLGDEVVREAYYQELMSAYKAYRESEAKKGDRP